MMLRVRTSTTFWTCALLAPIALPSRAWAGEAPVPGGGPAERRGPALEVDVLLPLFGITDDKLLVPIVRPTKSVLRGELMLGTYADYAWGPISRPADQYGKVWLLGARPGYRQYLADGFFVDASIVFGWRHEDHDVHDGGTLDGLYGRLWAEGGWQLDLTERTFVNVRGGAGVILFRSDRYGYTEKPWQPAGDVNVGVRF